MADQDDIDALLNDDAPSDAGGTEGPSKADSDGDGFNLDSLIEEGEPGQDLLSIEEATEPMRTAKDLEAVYDIPVQLSAVLGNTNGTNY